MIYCIDNNTALNTDATANTYASGLDFLFPKEYYSKYALIHWDYKGCFAIEV